MRTELERVADFSAITAEEAAPIGDVPDVRSALALSRTAGAMLSGPDLKEIATAIASIRRMRGFLRARGAGRPRILAYLGALHAFPDLDRRLGDALDEEGALRDDASPELRAIRRELRQLRAEIERRLARLFHRAGAASVIADEYVTVRNGRFVIPVRAAAAAEMPGIVQDRSASGETLFVEPLFAVERNNRLLIAAREEAQEEARVLTELTGLIGLQADALEEAFATLIELDTLGARAAFGRRHAAVCAEVGGGTIALHGVRHPLLALTGRPVVPIDIVLEPDTRLLIVTGPNTGGKSVALKTLGIAALMAQSGLPVLADPGAELPVFSQVLTDIGDRQTVAGDLSTFSGHVTNLAEILSLAGTSSLVLLDEPGTGTDPADGAALAKVSLRRLTERGARVLATTHFEAVKIYALAEPGAMVAAVDFDPESFAPRYRLIYGSVGPSLGLPIARRLGLPDDLLAAAERERGRADDLPQAVARLEAERARYEAEASAASREQRALAELRRTQERLVAELTEKRSRKWSDELGEARRFADELKSEGHRLLAEARERPREGGRALIELGREQRARIERQSRQVLQGEPQPDADAMREQAPAPGDQVEVVGSNLRGTLIAVSGERAQVSRGSVRFDVPVKQLRRVPGASSTPTPSSTPVAPRAPAREPVREETARDLVPAIEINLIGEHVKDGLARLEAFLDHATLDAAAKVRIIHGSGSGTLRSAVRRYLADSPYVSKFEEGDPLGGGSGVTIAYLT
ncbi:MAG TPA: Smr/MutS family protein [Candidatus Bathyarchaeia archaeon]|nr:Smr/MutS family protein [Candidatus Bathyarchaeia archaeon]